MIKAIKYTALGFIVIVGTMFSFFALVWTVQPYPILHLIGVAMIMGALSYTIGRALISK